MYSGCRVAILIPGEVGRFETRAKLCPRKMHLCAVTLIIMYRRTNVACVHRPQVLTSGGCVATGWRTSAIKKANMAPTFRNIYLPWTDWASEACIFREAERNFLQWMHMDMLRQNIKKDKRKSSVYGTPSMDCTNTSQTNDVREIQARTTMYQRSLPACINLGSPGGGQESSILSIWLGSEPE